MALPIRVAPLFNLTPAVLPPRLPRPVVTQPTAIPTPPLNLPSTPTFEPAPLPETCPAGFQWDPIARSCVPVGPTIGGNFPGGSPPQGGTPPIVTGGTGVTVTPAPETVGEGPIYVNVANAVNVSDASAANAIDGVASAVRSGIQSGIDGATRSADAAISAVQYGIDNLTSQLAYGLDQSFSQTAGVISGLETGISSTLGGIGQTIGQDIFNAINPVSTGLSQIITVIANQIGGLAGAIAQAVGQVLPTIVGLISGAINPLTAVIQGISNEISQSVAAQVSIGNDISGGFTTLDSTLGRLLTSWETYNSPFVESQTGYPDNGNLHQDLSKIWQALSGLVTTLASSPVFKASEWLAPPCNSQTIENLLNAPVTFGDPGNSFFGDMARFLWGWALQIIKIFPTATKYWEVLNQSVNQECPTELLPISSIVDADLRGFLGPTQAASEAGRQGLDPTRYKTLRDLATHQLAPQELVEALFRGIITTADYATALQAQGWTPGQQNILQGIGVNLLNLTELWDLVRRGTIDAPAQDAGLKALHYDDAQRKALASLTFRPPTMNEAIEGAAAGDALQGTGAAAQGNLFVIPEFVQAAAAAEGLNVQATEARWASHWSTGSIGLWLDAYFRGLTDFGGLQAVLRRNFIPDPLDRVVVEASRPLIQFRTISRMVFLKLLTPEQGKAQLLRHGYSDADAQTLIDYALVSGKAPAAQRAQTQHAVSIGIAKEEYIDGSISAAQFYDVLIAHNYTPDGANTEIAVINAHESMLARKAAAQLIVDEYGAGLINEQVALAQLAAQGLTVAELAKYAHKIRAFRTKNAKLPTESELLKMLKAGIISKDDYINALIAQGYSSKWSNAFYDLGFPSNPPASGSATP